MNEFKQCRVCGYIHHTINGLDIPKLCRKCNKTLSNLQECES